MSPVPSLGFKPVGHAHTIVMGRPTRMAFLLRNRQDHSPHGKGHNSTSWVQPVCPPRPRQQQACPCCSDGEQTTAWYATGTKGPVYSCSFYRLGLVLLHLLLTDEFRDQLCIRSGQVVNTNCTAASPRKLSMEPFTGSVWFCQRAEH